MISLDLLASLLPSETWLARHFGELATGADRPIQVYYLTTNREVFVREFSASSHRHENECLRGHLPAEVAVVSIPLGVIDPQSGQQHLYIGPREVVSQVMELLTAYAAFRDHVAATQQAYLEAWKQRHFASTP